MPPVQIGEVMRSGGMGTIIEAGEGSKLKVGDVVWGMLGTCSSVARVRGPQKRS